MERTLSRHPTPVHLWIVGIVSLLWNSFGCYDYVMTKLAPATYLPSVGVTGAAADYMTGMPAWFTLAWALGVWGSLAGSVLLLARSRHAVMAFGISLAGFLISHVIQLVQPPPPEMMSAAIWAMTAVIALTLVAQLIYCRRMVARSVLR